MEVQGANDMNQFMKWQVKYVLIKTLLSWVSALFEIQVCGVMMPESKELLKYFELIMLPWGKSSTSGVDFKQLPLHSAPTNSTQEEKDAERSLQEP